MNMPLSILNRRRRGGGSFVRFIPSGSTGLITSNSLIFKARGVAVPVGEWNIEGSTILEAPTPPDQPIVIEDRIEA